MSTEHENQNEKTPVRVLLVEDDEDDYLLTRELIEDMNHRQYMLDWVPDFDTAVETIERGEHDVYLLDYRLGAHNGLELLRETKKMRGPAILLTGQGASDLDVAALQAGASDYLDKQRLDAGDLERAILYGLHQKRRQDELERQVQERTENLHRANLELREREERLAAIFNQSTSGFAQADLMGRFVLVNDRYCDIVGRSREELLVLRMQDLTHPDDLPGNLEQFREVVDGVRCSFAVEKRYVKPDGSWVWVHNEVSVIRDSAGMPRSVAVTVTDITERKRAEEQLRESEERLKLFIEHAPAGIAMFDLDMRYLACSHRWREDYHLPEEVVGRSHYELFPDLPVKWEEAHRLGLAGETLHAEEDPFTGLDGRTQWVSWDIRPWRRADGAIGGILIGAEDITQRVETQYKLRESENTLRVLAGQLEQLVEERTRELVRSQDRLRALASELNLAEQRERKRLAAELHDHLQQMLVYGKLMIGQSKRAASGVPAYETALKKVDDILSEALTYSRTLVAELSPPVLRDQGLAASLKWLAEYMKNKHEQTVTVVLSDDEGLNLPEDQVILLFQSVRELLINSSKHAGTGEATIRMEQRQDQLHIQVGDQGAGFDFAAAAAAAAAAGMPSGGISSKFGLYSIQERMRALGGSFKLESAPGKGATATLLLPLLQHKAKVKVAAKDSETSLSSTSALTSHLTPDALRIRVLLVDDHVMVRQGLRSVLDAYADVQVVEEAGDGEEAVRLTEGLRPAVVVMDINMPRMNGIEAAEQITRRHPDTIVIGISVNAADENQEAMQRAGAVRLMTKEAAVEELYDAIQEAIRRTAGRHTDIP